MKKKTIMLVLKYASLNGQLKRKDYRVLLYLMPKLARLDEGEFARINQAKIADDLEIAKTDVSRSIKKLIEAKIIEPQNKEKGWKLDIRLHPYEYDEIENILFGDDDE